MKPSTWSADVWACGLLTLGTLTAFCQVVTFDFVNFDDNVYVTANMDVQAGAGVVGCALLLLLVLRGWIPFLCVLLGVLIYTDAYLALESIFTAQKSGHWHPLTWLSLATDYEIFGLHAWGFHLTNLLLHLANTLLLYAVLRRSTPGNVWRCFLVAALFGWHPLHVESVAWITERKDVLSTFFWMLTMLAYLDFVWGPVCNRSESHGPVTNRSPHGRDQYRLVILFFLLGLLSKPMIVTLPCVLLLWDVWPLGRVSLTSPIGWRHVLVEKIPLFILAVISGIWTTVVMRQDPTNNMGEVLTIGSRFANALLAMVFYLKKMLWPSELGPSYPVFAEGPPPGEVIQAGLIVAVCTIFAVSLVRRAPYVLIGWLWFAGTVLPVSLRLQKGSFTWADRYSYVPLIGIFIVVVWGIGDLLSGWKRRWSVALQMSLAAGVLLACLAVTWQQVKIWADSETLWTRALEIDPCHFIGHVNLAAHLEGGRPEEALELLRLVVHCHPNIARGHRELGLAYEKRGRLEQALACYRKAVELDPDNVMDRGLLANVLFKLGREREAKEVEERK